MHTMYQNVGTTTSNSNKFPVKFVLLTGLARTPSSHDSMHTANRELINKLLKVLMQVKSSLMCYRVRAWDSGVNLLPDIS